MAYNVNLSNGDLLAIVEDGTADISSSSVALVGKNFPGYGEYVNENFIHMVENFSGEYAPANQLTGQLWYNTTSNELKIWNSTDWVSAGKPAIVNDTVSSTPQYLTFVNASSGSPDFKVSATKGIVFVPSTGNFGLGATPGARLTVSTNTGNVISSVSPNTNTTLHVHGDNGKDQVVLIESYGGPAGTYSVNNAPTIAFRRNNGTGAALEAVKNNDMLGQVGAQGYTGLAHTATRAGMAFYASENWSAGSNGSKIVFRTTAVGSTLSSNAVGILSDKTLECYGNLYIGGTFIAAGSIKAGGDVTAYYTSDSRLKNNVERISDALDKTCSLDGVTFNWNELATEKDQSVKEAGVLAQQIQKVLPEAVTERTDGHLAVRYEMLVPLLIEAIKELKAEVDSLRNAA